MKVEKCCFKTILIIGGIFFLSTLALAQPLEGGKRNVGRQREKRIENLVKELNLTPEQRDKIVQYRQKEREKSKALREKLHSKLLELRQELDKANINKNKAYSLIDEITALRREMLRQRVNSIITMKKILTPEQFKKLQKKVRRRIKSRFLKKQNNNGNI